MWYRNVALTWRWGFVISGLAKSYSGWRYKPLQVKSEFGEGSKLRGNETKRNGNEEKGGKLDDPPEKGVVYGMLADRYDVNFRSGRVVILSHNTVHPESVRTNLCRGTLLRSPFPMPRIPRNNEERRTKNEVYFFYSQSKRTSPISHHSTHHRNNLSINQFTFPKN